MINRCVQTTYNKVTTCVMQGHPLYPGAMSCSIATVLTLPTLHMSSVMESESLSHLKQQFFVCICMFGANLQSTFCFVCLFFGFLSSLSYYRFLSVNTVQTEIISLVSNVLAELSHAPSTKTALVSLLCPGMDSSTFILTSAFF